MSSPMIVIADRVYGQTSADKVTCNHNVVYYKNEPVSVTITRKNAKQVFDSLPKKFISVKEPTGNVIKALIRRDFTDCVSKRPTSLNELTIYNCRAVFLLKDILYNAAGENIIEWVAEAGNMILIYTRDTDEGKKHLYFVSMYDIYNAYTDDNAVTCAYKEIASATDCELGISSIQQAANVSTSLVDSTVYEANKYLIGLEYYSEEQVTNDAGESFVKHTVVENRTIVVKLTASDYRISAAYAGVNISIIPNNYAKKTGVLKVVEKGRTLVEKEFSYVLDPDAESFKFRDLAISVLKACGEFIPTDTIYRGYEIFDGAKVVIKPEDEVTPAYDNLTITLTVDEGEHIGETIEKPVEPTWSDTEDSFLEVIDTRKYIDSGIYDILRDFRDDINTMRGLNMKDEFSHFIDRMDVAHAALVALRDANQEKLDNFKAELANLLLNNDLSEEEESRATELRTAIDTLTLNIEEDENIISVFEANGKTMTNSLRKYLSALKAYNESVQAEQEAALFEKYDPDESISFMHVDIVVKK